jgi:hypothetical protein
MRQDLGTSRLTTGQVTMKPIGAKRRSRGKTRDQSLLDEVQHLVEIHLSRVEVRVNGRLRPVGEPRLAERAVVDAGYGLLRYLVQNVERRPARGQTPSAARH